MHSATRYFFLGASLIALGTHAQIPPQPGSNPNAVPPRVNRPGRSPILPPSGPGGRPLGGSGAPGVNSSNPNANGGNAAPGAGANGEAKASMRPDEAVTPSGNYSLQFPNAQLSDILLLYEEMTGLKVIRDANAEQATVSVDTTGEMPKEKAIMFIEKSLLLNGYSFVPSGEGMVKLLAFDAKKPQTEGAPLIESAMDLPETDQVVSFVALLKYLNGEDATKAIDQVIPRHSYGVITPVPNAKALVITENSATIRSILALLERLDNKPATTTSKTFQLVRSDAEDVKKALDEILGTDEKKTGGSTSSGNRPAVPQVQNAQGGVQPQAVAAASLDYAGGGSTTDIPPKLIAIPRRNSLLVIATPETMELISTLITELDAASELRNFVSRTLNYLGVDAAMGIISDAISRGEGDGEGGNNSGVNSLGQSGSSSTQNANRTTSNSTGNSMFGSNSSQSGFGSSGGLGSSGGGGMGGFGSSGTSGAGASLQPLRSDEGPRSIVVGKTLLISDPTANSIFASGPPEHLRVLNEIIDELDVRPQQILISVVIGELNLDNDKGFSLDTILRGALTRSNGSSAAAGGLRGGNAALLDPRNIRTLADFTGGLASGLTLYGGLADGVDVIVKTLETNGDFRVMSRPTIFTMNNRAATITSGVSIPVATSTQGLLSGGGANNSTGLISNVQYQPVVLSLQILPLINSEDELTLQISQENNEASESKTNISGNDYPELSQQTLNTTVLVKNRATVLLGGLIRESKNKSKSGLPFISRIPVLGALTGSQSVGITRRELLIFIQPRIVHGMTDLPPTVEDAPGTSPFGSEVQNLLVQEKDNLAEARVPASQRRPSIGRLLKKLFSKEAALPPGESFPAAP